MQECSIDSYRNVAPAGTVDLIYRLSALVKDKTLLHINSTKFGGGVAEMLHRLIPLFNNLGVKARWDIISGSPGFFQVTKCFHNALQGQPQVIGAGMLDEYLKINRQNARKLDLDADMVIIHDPQPAALIRKKKSHQKWLWRCHIDVSHPQRKVWNFLKEYVSLYDGAIFSLPNFAQRLAIPQVLVYPSIDPLSEKNRELTPEEIRGVLEKLQIPMDRPIILQVSRFDRFKDPIGVIRAYEMVKKYNDCCLVLAGGSADDDPEGLEVLNEVRNAAAQDKDIFVLDLPTDANLEINALQRAATIVLQKSIKEGFGLTVSEAMWKGKPVIGGFVGGIRSQIIYGETGYTVHTSEGCAYQIRFLLNNPELMQRIGRNAREFTRSNFLITRHVCDYLSLMIYFQTQKRRSRG